MLDEKPETTAEPDSDSWEVLQAFFLRPIPSASPIPAFVTNWNQWQSQPETDGHSTQPPSTESSSDILDISLCPPDLLCFWWKWYYTLPQNGTIEPEKLDFWLSHFAYFLTTYCHPSILPAHQQIELALAAANQSKRHAEEARLKSHIAQQAAETAKLNAQLAHRATEIAKTQTEAANVKVQSHAAVIDTVKAKVVGAETEIKTAKLNADRASREIETAKAQADAANAKVQADSSAIEGLRTNAEAVVDEIKVVTIKAHRSSEEIETIKHRAEADQKKIEDLLITLRGNLPPSPPDSPRNTNPLLVFLKKHKPALLLGAIALIPPLILLSQILNPPPLSAIYVDPITGNDTNNGTGTAPFRTLSHALKHAGAGSNIYLAKGDYSTDRSLTIPANTSLIIQPFNDINGHWAAPFIRALAAQGLIAGYPDGSFKPDANLTRAEYATLLTKVFNLTEAQSVNQFTDVSPDFWAYPSIQSTYNQAFLKGFPEGDFKPNDNVQRVQVIAALVSGLGLTPTSSEQTLSIYQDRSLIPSWATAQTATATIEKLIVNYPNVQQLNPIQSATRAETVVMMYQALVKQGKMPPIESPYLVQQ